jgi:hypothetical protein
VVFTCHGVAQELVFLRRPALLDRTAEARHHHQAAVSGARRREAEVTGRVGERVHRGVGVSAVLQCARGLRLEL